MIVMRKWIVLGLCVGVALLSLFIFGTHHVRSWADAQQYDDFAVSIVQGHGYTMDGSTFTAEREPGYPLFLAAIYTFFGADNFLAVSIIQALVVALIGFMVYRLFVHIGEENLGIIIALLVSVIPYYGFYSYEILTEMLFAFVLALIFYFCARTAPDAACTPWYIYAVIGLLCAYGTLVRVQLLFFLPFLILCYAVFIRVWSPIILKKIVLACGVFVLVVGSWVLYVHAHTGSFVITTSRGGTEFYIRADRAQLSYKELTRYVFEWIKRSSTGGQSSDFLENHEFHRLQAQYNALASTTVAAALVDKQSIATILHNPGHYLFGNGIEVMKTLYIEHDFSDSMSKYLRAGVYVFVYGLCAFGFCMLLRSWKRADPQLRTFSVLSLLFILYNCAILSFFDSIPRYNTPYLFFYLIVGFVGIALWRGNRANSTRQGQA